MDLSDCTDLSKLKFRIGMLDRRLKQSDEMLEAASNRIDELEKENSTLRGENE